MFPCGHDNAWPSIILSPCYSISGGPRVVVAVELTINLSSHIIELQKKELIGKYRDEDEEADEDED